jgi:epoxyqueuosine reductase
LLPEERPLLGSWVFGCDICQEVCPFNFLTLKRREPAALPELGAAAGAGGALDLGRVLHIRTQQEFVATFGGTALMRATRPGLLRNAAVVAANTAAVQLLEPLCLVAREESAAVVRQHALWAAARIAQRQGTLAVGKVRELLQRASTDPDIAVRAEAAALHAALG